MIRCQQFLFTYRGAFVPLGLAAIVLFPGETFGWTERGVGLVLLAIGMGFRVAGVRGIGGRARVHTAGARTLVTNGIYGRVRNPIYVGNLLFAAGLTAMASSLLASAALATYVLLLYTAVICWEERVLEPLYGQPYQQYLRDVPRWMVKLWNTAGSADSDLPRDLTPWKKVLWLERYFLGAGVALALLFNLTSAHAWRLFGGNGEMSRAAATAIGLGVVATIVTVTFLRVRAKIMRRQGG